jgi:hypothetical protein
MGRANTSTTLSSVHRRRRKVLAAPPAAVFFAANHPVIIMRVLTDCRMSQFDKPDEESAYYYPTHTSS